MNVGGGKIGLICRTREGQAPRVGGDWNVGCPQGLITSFRSEE